MISVIFTFKEKTMGARIISLFTLLFLQLFLQAQTSSILAVENNIISLSGADSGRIQTLLNRMETLRIPGVSIAVFDSGHIIWAKGYGLADKKTLRKVDSNTVFQAASISKPLTTVAMFAMAEKNLIDPDKDINLQIRNWKVPDNEYTSQEKVTPRRIVSHMAGLSVHGFYGYGASDKIPTLVQILNGSSPANNSPIVVNSRPGVKESYSGGGFVLLQLLLEETTSKPFPELMNELVLRPAGMTNSIFSLKPVNPDVTAMGFDTKGKMVKGGYRRHPEQAAAGLWTTPSDLARFMLNIGDSYRGIENKILQQSTVQKMFTKVPGGSGLGFGVDGNADSLRFRHSGGNEGYTCYAVSFAEIGRGVVIMTNSNNGSRLIREIVRAISKEYKWPPM